jgi:hypothetical protein
MSVKPELSPMSTADRNAYPDSDAQIAVKISNASNRLEARNAASKKTTRKITVPAAPIVPK